MGSLKMKTNLPALTEFEDNRTDLKESLLGLRVFFEKPLKPTNSQFVVKNEDQIIQFCIEKNKSIENLLHKLNGRDTRRNGFTLKPIKNSKYFSKMIGNKDN